MTDVDRLPVEGGTLDQVVSTFSVTFSEELDASTLVSGAFDLRGAGADGLFDTGDDVVYALSQSYDANNRRLNFTVSDGPIADGLVRLTIADSVTDVVGNALDGDGDTNADGDFVRTFTVDAVPVGGVFEGRDNDGYLTATALSLTADPNGTGWLRSEVGYGSIDPTSDTDWWSFEGQAGDRVDVWSQVLAGSSSYIQLYRLNDAGTGVQSLTGDNSGYELPETATYFVR